MSLFKIAFTFLVFLLIGCGSKVPIADLSKAVISDQIVGNWTSVAKDSSEYLEFAVRKFNNQEYAVWVYEEKKDSTGIDTKIYFYRLYLVDIEGILFINAQDINTMDPSERLYHFLQYEPLTDSTAAIIALKDIDGIKIDKFETSGDLYQFIRKNITNKKLYGDRVELIRLKEMRSF